MFAAYSTGSLSSRLTLLPPWLTGAWNSRGSRIALLMALVLVMSAIDLYLTLNQMTSHGMFEGNPLVVFLVESTNSAAGVTLFKALTVAFAVGVILRLRQYVSAELGAWIMTIVLVVLMVQWVRYAAFFSALDPEILDEMRRQAGWVVIG